jgi:hypothetical protein
VQNRSTISKATRFGIDSGKAEREGMEDLTPSNRLRTAERSIAPFWNVALAVSFTSAQVFEVFIPRACVSMLDISNSVYCAPICAVILGVLISRYAIKNGYIFGHGLLNGVLSIFVFTLSRVFLRITDWKTMTVLLVTVVIVLFIVGGWRRAGRLLFFVPYDGLAHTSRWVLDRPGIADVRVLLLIYLFDVYSKFRGIPIAYSLQDSVSGQAFLPALVIAVILLFGRVCICIV